MMQSALASDLAEARFLAGVDGGRWRLIALDEPSVDIGIRAAVRPAAPSEYVIRFDCARYPGVAPTGRPWDVDLGDGLEPVRWPSGGRATSVFNPDWRRDALYLPLDRLAQAGHEGWRDTHPDRWWGSASTIVDYLEEISDVLNARAYSGTREPQ